MAILSPLCSVLLPSCSSTPLYSEESYPIPLFKHQSSLASPCCLWCQHGVVFIYMSVLISSFIVNVVFILSCTFMQAHAHACVHVHTPIYIKFWHLKKNWSQDIGQECPANNRKRNIKALSDQVKSRQLEQVRKDLDVWMKILIMYM